MGGQDAGIPGGTGPGVLWWDRDRVLGSVVGKGQDSGIQARQFLHARDAFLLSPRGEQRCQPRVGRVAAAFRWRRRRCGSSRGAVGAWGQQRTPGGAVPSRGAQRSTQTLLGLALRCRRRAALTAALQAVTKMFPTLSWYLAEHSM